MPQRYGRSFRCVIGLPRHAIADRLQRAATDGLSSEHGRRTPRGLALTRRRVLGMLLASAGAPGLARAGSYPSGRVTIVVPSAAGGQFDSIARQMGRPMAADLGQPIIIENIG